MPKNTKRVLRKESKMQFKMGHPYSDCYGPELAEWLVGARILDVCDYSGTLFVLKDDVMYDVKFIEYPNACSCGNGASVIHEVAECPNVITKAEYVEESHGDYGGYIYKIFVYADNKKIRAAFIEGFDNGYYGTGFDFIISIGEE